MGFLVLLLACQGDMPTEGSQEIIPFDGTADVVLFPTDDSMPGYETVDSIGLTVPPLGGTTGELELGEISNSSGPVVIEIAGSFALDSVPISLGEVINSNGMLSFQHAMVVFREADAVPVPPGGYVGSIERNGVVLDFELLRMIGGELVVQDVFPEPVDALADSVRLVLDSAARGTLRVRWRLNDGGGRYFPDEHPSGLLPILGRLVPFPPEGRLWTINTFADLPRASGSFSIVVRRQPIAVSRLRASRDTVFPVVADSFDAQSQHIRRSYDRPVVRRDTVLVTIPGVASATSVRRAIWLESRPVAGSGGHTHVLSGNTDRPQGTFFPLNELAEVADSGAGHRNRIRIVRPVGRDTTLVYRTTGIAGRDWLVMRPVNADLSATDSVQIAIRLTGLVSVATSTDNYHLGPSDNHVGFDRYLQPGVIDTLNSLWAAWRALHAQRPGKYPMTGTDFSVDATSLEEGGLLDISGRWRLGGHLLHKEGLDVDFNNNAVERNTVTAEQPISPRRLFQDICRTRRYHYSPTQSFTLDCQTHRNGVNPEPVHFHVVMIPVASRDSTVHWRK